MSGFNRFSKWNERSVWMFSVFGCLIVMVLGVFMTSHVAFAVTGGIVQVISEQDTAGYVDADYNAGVISFNSGATDISTVTIAFPDGYTISGGISASDICSYSLGCTESGIGKVDINNVPTTISGVLGNYDGPRQIKIGFFTPQNLYTGAVNFKIVSGITNPVGSGSYGPFTMTLKTWDGITRDVVTDSPYVTIVTGSPPPPSPTASATIVPLSGQDKATKVNADYHIHYYVSDTVSVSDILIHFPVGYVIQDGSIANTEICNDDYCTYSGLINKAGSTYYSATPMTLVGNASARTIGIHFFTPVGFSGDYIDFMLKSGITNPSAGTTGSFSITSSGVPDATADPITITEITADHLKFSASVSDQVAGVSFVLPAIEVVNAIGVRDTSYNQTLNGLTFVMNGLDTRGSFTTSVTFVNGLSTTTLATTLNAAQTGTIIVYPPEIAGFPGTDTASNEFTITPNIAGDYQFTDILESVVPVAGVPLVSHLLARDFWSNPVTSYSGTKTITFSESESSPDGFVAKSYIQGGAVSNFGTPLTMHFVSGVSEEVLVLIIYKSGVGTVSFHMTDGGSVDIGCNGEGGNCFSVENGPAASLRVTGSATMVAGGDNTVTITAKDAYGNDVNGANYAQHPETDPPIYSENYTGTKSLTFSGPSVSLNSDIPTVSGTEIGTAQSVTFTNGVSQTRTLIAYKAEAATLDVTDGSIDSTGDVAHDLNVAVASASIGAFGVSVSNAAPVAGTPINLTVTAKDAYLNPALYTGMILITTSAAAPYTIQPSMFRFVSADNGVKTFPRALTFNIGETVSVSVSDFNDGTISGTQTGIVVSDAPATFALTGIDTLKSYATADGTYANGFAWLMHVTVPADQTKLKLRFSDFTSGSHMLAATTIRYCSAQSDKTCASSVEESSDYMSVAAADQSFLDISPITIDSDLDLITPGKQIQVRVEMKVPALTPSGSFSGSYGLESSTPAV